MANDSVPYLCGGIFFALLIQVKYEGTASDKVNNRYNGISDPVLMANLIRVVTGILPDSTRGPFRKSVSEYRNCLINGGKNVPFDQTPVIFGFDDSFKNRYISVLNRMIDLTDSCIFSENPGRMVWLVKSLLAVIEKDSSIADSDVFYIYKNEIAMTKAEIINCTAFELQPFLLGVLHYLITRPTKNKHGKPTYDAFYPTRDTYLVGTFDDGIISDIERRISVTNLQKEKEPVADTQQTQTDFSTPDMDAIDDERADTSSTKIVNQYINNPTVVNQYGENNIHIDYVENLKI
ncbi:hypothetical protein ACIZ62_08535 [Acetobacterium carbinolicum]|jgi:hypothetical protein|uniref:hypothetical protein n=1 Tax=Acetobacterium TaxID=33951 RepID=UPI00257BC723|nr:hypothetical protein [Acetobacterium sp. UBA5834]MDD3306937.1 hypothetical protein [Acetobacterium sp.]